MHVRTSSFVSRFRPAAVVVGCGLVAAAFTGCAPAARPGSKGEVVEIERIDAAAPADAAAKGKEIDEAAARSKKIVDDATAAADNAIAAAGATIDNDARVAGKGEPAMPKKAEEVAAKPAEPAKPADAPKPAEPAPAAEPKAAAAAAREKVNLGDPALTAGVPGSGPITLEQIDAWLADPRTAVELEPVLPLGLSQGAQQITGLEANPLTRAKIELGRQLYFDPRLSADKTVSCASCHDPAAGYSAHTKTGVGIGGQKGGRNSPVSYNRILSGPQFWDGRADSLEAQAVGPIQNPIEMGFTHEGVVKRLGEMPVYRRQFEKIFGGVSIDAVGKAIAAFERALVTAPSPYDFGEQLRSFANLDPDDIAEDPELKARYAAAKAAAEAQPMSEAAVRGREIFFTERGNCTACHVGANLADEKYHNIGIGMDKPEPDVGRFAVTKNAADTGGFKTPTIRNVALSAPYMHDGSVATLEEVVEWYDKGGHPNPHLSEKIRPLKLSAQDKADLVEFMKACTGPTPTVEVSRLPADD
jgi:cytochrome c peroxidase